MLYGACCVPVSPVKKEPSHASEMVSQLLFSERCTLLETFQGDWIKIQGKVDGYVGWCQQSHLVNIDEDEFEDKRIAYTRKWISQVEYEHQIMQLPLGSSLAGCKKSKVRLGNKSLKYHGKLWWSEEIKVTGKKIEQIAREFINTSYLWGGKTVFGTDCSGFTQAVYKFFNILLPRDAWQQAEMGEPVLDLQKAKRGDLLFFDNEQGKIVHVGILLRQCKIIHSSGKVRIDKIDKEGIINLSTGKRTHHLSSIRKYF